MCSAKDHVLSTLESGHLMVQNKCRLRANSGLVGAVWANPTPPELRGASGHSHARGHARARLSRARLRAIKLTP